MCRTLHRKALRLPLLKYSLTGLSNYDKLEIRNMG